MTPPHEHNRKAWDRLARGGHRFSSPPSESEFRDPLATVDGLGWLGASIRQRRLLCLAGGGGRQGPLYAAAGADVTVVDISEYQLEIDRQIAKAQELQLRTVQTSMDNLSMFGDSEFEIVIHPVSTCYLSDLAAVYAAICRVICPGGLYVSQHKVPTSLQLGESSRNSQYFLEHPYYLAGPLPSAAPSRVREAATQEYIHRWESLLGLMCRAGFVIEDLVEPLHADPRAGVDTFGHRSRFVAPYVRVKARRQVTSRGGPHSLWTPG